MIRRKFSLGPLGFKDKPSSSKPTAVMADPDFSPPQTPHPDRRPPLPSNIEADLRAACADIVENLIPSDVLLENQQHDQRRESERHALKQQSQPNFQFHRPLPPQLLPDAPQRDRRATISEVPDFPLPSMPLNRHKYPYKPDAVLRSLFPEAEGPAQAVQVNVNRRRGDYVGLSNEGPMPARTFTRPLSQQFTLSSNLPSASLDSFPRPNLIRPKHSYDTDKATPQTDSTEYPWSTSTTATSAAITPGYPSSKQPLSVEQLKSRWENIEAAIAAERQRSAYVKQQQSTVSMNNAATTTTRVPSRPTSRPLSRARSISQGIKDYIRPGSSDGREKSVSRPGTAKRSESRESRRSNASSGVLPAGKQRFSWKSWRQSWQSFRSGVDSEADFDGQRGRAEKRQSKDDMKKAQVNLNRDLPPLPGLDQWKGEEEPEKPKHIASLWKRKSQDLNKRKSGDLNKRRSGDLIKMRSSDFRSNDIVESPILEAEPLKIDVIEEIPAAPAVRQVTGDPATVTSRRSPDVNRKPVPIKKSQSPPADSVLGDQDRSGSVRSGVKSPIETRIPTGYHTANTSISPMPVLDSELDEIVPSSFPKDVSVQDASETDQSETAASANKRRPVKLDLDVITHASPKLYEREFDQQNGDTNFVARNLSVDNYQRATTSKYRYADEISTLSSPPPVPPKDFDKKGKWPFKLKTKRQMTWMDEMEKLGVRDGLLLTDDLQGSPIVRY